MSTYLPEDIHSALERFIAEKHPRLNQTEAIALILRQWLTKEGYLAPSVREDGVEPDELNASNDD